ncbi:hypothetical protein BDEG_27073 [Batrachochytrium dendrobatidis JEL423]|uniref:PIN domain-containing protein n=1 Tax=Batrachochytrium dendrobatidis (strain JEL423) TaxID=403673 RepID=A0A177WVU2_BATDL|nr:hypothetical protein BDEG_27073 [Batrachochytrium dendrobatidis JEL423]
MKDRIVVTAVKTSAKTPVKTPAETCSVNSTKNMNHSFEDFSRSVCDSDNKHSLYNAKAQPALLRRPSFQDQSRQVWFDYSIRWFMHCFRNIMLKKQITPSNLKSSLELRQSIAVNYLSLIKLDNRLNIKYGLDSRLWKAVVYPTVDYLRKQICAESELSESDSQSLWKSWLLSIQDIYTELLTMSHNSSSIISHKISNSLGDLKRYQAQNLTNDRAGKRDLMKEAKSYYLFASRVAPQNGFYQSQIAGVTVTAGIPLESVCHYIAALCAQVPFEPARESLRNVFSIVQDIPFKDTISSFISLIDTLFTRIRHVILELYKQKYSEFNALLADANFKFRQTSSAESNVSNETKAFGEHLYYMCVITIGTVLIISRQSLNPLLMDQLLENCCMLLTVLVDSAGSIQLTKSCSNDTVDRLSILESILFLLVSDTGCKVARFINWRTIQATFKTIQDQLLDFIENKDESMATLQDYSITEMAHQFHVPRDDVLITMSIFKCSIKPSLFSTAEIDTDSTQTLRLHYTRLDVLWKHVTRIHESSFMSLKSDCATKYNAKNSHGKKQVSKQIKQDLTQSDTDNASFISQEPAQFVKSLDLFESLENLADSFDDDADIKALKITRDELEGIVDRKNVKPKEIQYDTDPLHTILVLDTNLYLHNFEQVKTMITSRKWHILIPLAVVSELDGLRCVESEIGKNAELALDLLTSIFDTPDSSLVDLKRAFVRVITSRGKMMHTLRVRSEEWPKSWTADQDSSKNEGGFSLRNADDLILNVCLGYGTNSTQSSLAPDAEFSWSTSKVVLVTHDINLRLKARALGVPVIDSIASVYKSALSKS